MTENTAHEFFYSKPRLVHIAANIGLAPILLYLVGIWSLPPTLAHLIMFAISMTLAIRYVKTRMLHPQMVIDDKTIRCKEEIALDTIRDAEVKFRSLKLSVDTDAGLIEKYISLNWAKRDEIPRILELVAQGAGLKSQSDE